MKNRKEKLIELRSNYENIFSEYMQKLDELREKLEMNGAECEKETREYLTELGLMNTDIEILSQNKWRRGRITHVFYHSSFRDVKIIVTLNKKRKGFIDSDIWTYAEPGFEKKLRIADRNIAQDFKEEFTELEIKHKEKVKKLLTDNIKKIETQLSDLGLMDKILETTYENEVIRCKIYDVVNSDSNLLIRIQLESDLDKDSNIDENNGFLHFHVDKIDLKTKFKLID